ncbi:MAG: hypothetical protein QNJ45_15410 [Ardenticatenaceae bacterium]|nr:hypothetical protein [Ardenticatenaceae bacterium]
MKQAISVSLGSTARDSESTIELLGEEVYLRREGWNGNVAGVTHRFAELDGQVDALGVGGIDLWLFSDAGRSKLHAGHKLVQGVKTTPLVDGSGLKNTLEYQVVPFMKEIFGPDIARKKVLITAAIDRFGMTRSFFEHGLEVICGELGFALGLPIPIRSRGGLRLLASSLLPLITRLPISVLYPTGEMQHEIVPKFGDWYQWADIIAGDCLYIKRHMPDDLSGKIIVTNTTTAEDREMFRDRGVTDLVTTTPLINGRTFGTNMLEAGLTAAAGKNRPLTESELADIIHDLNLKPTHHKLSGHLQWMLSS